MSETTVTMPRSRAFQAVDLAVFGAVILAAVGHLIIKAGLAGAVVAASHASILGRLAVYFTQPYVLLGLAIYGIGTAMWVLAVSKHDISYVYPLSALNYVLVTLGGRFLFSESIPGKRWLGVAVVVAGIALMQTSAPDRSK